MDAINSSRRQVLKGSAAAMAYGAIGSLGALYSRQASAAADSARRLPVPSRYGPLAPVADLSTGLPLLQLPRGFSYRSFAWSGDRMDDGQPCPDRHDGMAVVTMRRPPFGSHGRGRPFSPEMVLIRNHERGGGTQAIQAPAMYDRGFVADGQVATGGTTTLRFRDGQWRGVEASLGGTLVNCAGGPTPWGTWLTCEETKTNAVSTAGHKHGYVFEVSPDRDRTSGRPLIGMGRFSHEAVAVDPRTGIVYLTEDDRNKSGLYRYLPHDRFGRYGSLDRGGRLQAARVRGRRNADLTTPSIGDDYALEWIDIEDPDLDSIAAPIGFPDIGSNDTLSGPFAQSWADGGLRMSRGEGIWYSYGKMFIVDTSAGTDAQGRRGRGNGTVWVLDLFTQRLRALFVSHHQLAGHNPDNITVNARGGVVLCEDPDAAPSGSPDEYGPGTRLIGLNRRGESFYLCKNNIELTSQQIADAGKHIAEGDYRESEFCGACWDPFARTLFVNIQTPGITVAITGPWERGPL